MLSSNFIFFVSFKFFWRLAFNIAIGIAKLRNQFHGNRSNEKNAQDEYEKNPLKKHHQFVLIPGRLDGKEMQQEKKFD